MDASKAISHTARNVAIAGVFVMLLGFFFFVPVIQPSNGLNLFELVSANATVSLSCQVFGFGEVHATSNLFGLTYDKWEWSTNC